MRWFKKPKVWQDAAAAMLWADELQVKRTHDADVRTAAIAAYRTPKTPGIHWDGEKYVGANDEALGG